MTIERSNDVWNITLQNKSTVLSYMNILKALNSAGEMVVPAIWSDNFVTLLPGETKVITCRTNARDVRFILDK
jgi:exo-1,4-beta-D-glucosaminidase